MEVGAVVAYHESQKGNNKAFSRGFTYNFHKLSKISEDIKLYMCELKQKNHCPARVHIQNDRIIKTVNQHNHAPDGQRGLALDVSIFL